MFHLIEDQNDLKILDEELIKLDFLAVDTEFYRKGKQDIKLSLIQVNNSEEIFIIDCIKLGTYKDNCKFLFSEKVTKSAPDFSSFFRKSSSSFLIHIA